MKTLFFLCLLTGCTPQSFFYYPNRTLYADPDRMGLHPELISYPSLNGKKLYGLLFQTTESPKGIVVHFHGNFGNMSNHFPLALFLTRRGYDLLSFDYEGYGASEGRPSPKRLVEDGIASVRYAQTRLRKPGTGVALFGQSLGGATAVVVAAKEPLVKAAVIEAAFSGHRAMARDVLKRSAWTWILYPVAPFLLGQSWDPIRFAASISPRPVFFIHGTADRTVPSWMSEKLYAAAREPKKIWLVEGADHLEIRAQAGPAYEEAIVSFLDDALLTNTKKD